MLKRSRRPRVVDVGIAAVNITDLMMMVVVMIVRTFAVVAPLICSKGSVRRLVVVDGGV